MSHFWVANEDPRLRAAQAADWLDDLAEFHEALVAEACAEWRRNETKRPTIAEIRQLCVEHTGPLYTPPPPEPSPPETPEQAAARLAERRTMAQKFGDLGRMLRGEIPWPRSNR